MTAIGRPECRPGVECAGDPATTRELANLRCAAQSRSWPKRALGCLRIALGRHRGTCGGLGGGVRAAVLWGFSPPSHRTPRIRTVGSGIRSSATGRVRAHRLTRSSPASRPQRGFGHTRDGLVSGWLGRLLGSASRHAHTDCQNTADVHSGSEFATLRIVVALITGAIRLNSVPLVLRATRLSSSLRRDERMIRSRRASRSSPDTSIVRTRARHAYAEGSG